MKQAVFSKKISFIFCHILKDFFLFVWHFFNHQFQDNKLLHFVFLSLSLNFETHPSPLAHLLNIYIYYCQLRISPTMLPPFPPCLF